MAKKVTRARSGEAQELRDLVAEIIRTDPRFKDHAQFLANVRFFWSLRTKTACAGIGFIFFNPDFYKSLPEATRVTIIAHEMWHLILKHLQRHKPDDDPYFKNIAEDHVININLKEQGFTFEGSDPCLDMKHKGKSSRQIYNEIWEARPEDRPDVDPTMQMTPQQIYDLIDETIRSMPEEDQMTQEELEQEANEQADEAQKNGCGRGAGQEGILLEITNYLVPITGASYKDIFADYMIDPLSGGKRTFSRPNRRQVGNRNSGAAILPGRYPRRGKENRLTHLVYALDVSGSITKAQAKMFNQSVATIKKLLNPSMLTVLFFDNGIRLEKTFTDKQPYGDIHVNAGGGTNLAPVYKRVEALNPEALVIFTDLQVHIPPQPKWHTIWFVPNALFAPPDLYGDLYLVPEAQVPKEPKEKKKKKQKAQNQQVQPLNQGPQVVMVPPSTIPPPLQGGPIPISMVNPVEAILKATGLSQQQIDAMMAAAAANGSATP